MKFFIALIVALATATYISGVPLCECPAALFKSSDSGKTVDSIKFFEYGDHDEVEMECCTQALCEHHCLEVQQRTGPFPKYNSTLSFLEVKKPFGEMMCEFFNRTVDQLYAGMYWQMGGDCPAKKGYTGYHSSELLCCDSTSHHSYTPC